MKYSAHILEQIRHAYQEGYYTGAIRDLSKRLRMPHQTISGIAHRHGFSRVTLLRNHTEWSEEELDILNKHAFSSIETIKRKLIARGFKRGLGVISAKRIETCAKLNSGGNNAIELAILLGIPKTTLLSRIKSGALKAKMTDSGDYFIKDKDVRSFVLNNMNQINLCKVEKFWFLSVIGDM